MQGTNTEVIAVTMAQLAAIDSIIESWRYKLGCDIFLVQVITDWARLQSGQEPLHTDPDFIKSASHVSQGYATLMQNGHSTPLAMALATHLPSTKQLDYYPTERGLVELTNRILMDDLPKEGDVKLYEPCVGTSGFMIEQIERLADARIHLPNPLSGVTVLVEDLNPTALHAFFLHLVFLLERLSLRLSRDVRPDAVTIVKIDVLRRDMATVMYDLRAPHISTNNQDYLLDLFNSLGNQP